MGFYFNTRLSYNVIKGEKQNSLYNLYLCINSSTLKCRSGGGGGSITNFGSLLKTIVQVAVVASIVAVAMSIPSPDLWLSYTSIVPKTSPFIRVAQTFAGNILLGGAVLCELGQNNPVYTGCNGSSNNNAGSGNSSSSGSGANTSQVTNVTDGKVGGCSSGNKLCGTNSCIPAEATCCQSVGLSGYCPAGNVCTRDGICEVATADNTTCSNLQGTKCISPANSCGQTNASSYKCDGSCTVFAAPIPAAPLPTSLLPCPRLWNTAKSVSSPPKSTMPLPAV